MLHFSLQSIQAAFDFNRAVAAIQDGFIAFSEGRVEMGAVGYLQFPEQHGECHIKSASLRNGEYFAVKVATGFPLNRETGEGPNNGFVVLLDSTTGAPLCLFEDHGWLTDCRTAIAGAIASRLILPRGAKDRHPRHRGPG